MKKVLSGLLILVAFFINFTNVNALSDDKSIIYKESKDCSSGDEKCRINISNLKTGSANFWIYKYNLTTGDNTYISYCLDPHKSSTTDYKLIRILGAENSEIVRAHDYGILEMLKVGYTNFNNTYETSDPTPETNPNPYVAQLSGTDLYVATSIAIRAYTLGLFGWGGNDSQTSTPFMLYQAGAFITSGADWAGWNPEALNTLVRLNQISSLGFTNCTSSGPACQQQYKKFLDRVYEKWDYDPSITLNGYSYGTDSYAIVYAAKEIFDIGMNAAYEYIKEGRTESTVVSGVTNVVQESRDENQIQEFIYANLEIKNFDGGAYINNFNITCNGCDTNKSTIDYIEYFDTNGNWIRLQLGSTDDLARIITPDENGYRNGTIRLRIHVTRIATEDTEDCNSKANFTVTYKYYDPNKEYIGAILGDIYGRDFQRMVIIDKLDSNGLDGSFSGVINGCTEAVCETKISVPVCSDDENDAIAEVLTDENIKKCILNNIDDADNTYQLTVENGGVDNDYCQVFCKEDYKETINDGIQGGIKLNPVVEDVDCGGFFQLTSHIEGQKDCYTGGDTSDKRIDREQFITDIIAAQKKMIENYDLYVKATVALANITSTSCSCGCCGSGTEWYSSGSYDGVEAVEDTNTSETGYVKTQEKEGSYSYVDSCSGSCSNDPETGCSGSCSSGSRSELEQEIKADITKATTGMSEGYTEYVNAIKAYNGCTAAWDNEYLFSQRIRFYYSEYHYEDEFTPYYDIIASENNQDLYYLEAQEDTLKEESEVVICKGDTNENYECQEEPVNFDGSLDLNVDEWNYVSDYGNSVYSQKTFTICDTTKGCRTSDRMISDATFIRKTVKKSQDYITPTIFYQIEANGKVTVNSGYTGNALKLDELINALPVSTKTTGGGIFKLMIEDLGEFYDTGEVGRLIDFNGDNESSSVAAAKEEIGTFDGEYTCHYYSPCRPDDCPDCDFICDEDECYWGDPGTCPDCEFDCPECVFNFDEIQLNFRPISTTDFNSADRKYGYNWDVTTTLGYLELLRLKADTAIEQIQEANETIFDDKIDEENSELDFSIRMTADIVNDLKEYNDNHEEEGGYANDSLTCYAYTADNGTKFANIFCYSDLIDELIDKYGEQITVRNRTNAASRSDEDNKANSQNYWETWEGWSESVRDENGQYTVIGGPSWR